MKPKKPIHINQYTPIKDKLLAEGKSAWLEVEGIEAEMIARAIDEAESK